MEEVKIIIYDIEKLTEKSLNEPCILTLYPYPKEVIIAACKKFLFTTFDLVPSIQSFAEQYFPTVDVVLLPMETNLVMYRIGGTWVVKLIEMLHARELHRKASFFTEFPLTIIEQKKEFEYESKGNRNIVKIPLELQ